MSTNKVQGVNVSINVFFFSYLEVKDKRLILNGQKKPQHSLGLFVRYREVLKHWLTKIFQCNLTFTDFVQLTVVITRDGIQDQCD